MRSKNDCISFNVHQGEWLTFYLNKYCFLSLSLTQTYSLSYNHQLPFSFLAFLLLTSLFLFKSSHMPHIYSESVSLSLTSSKDTRETATENTGIIYSCLYFSWRNKSTGTIFIADGRKLFHQVLKLKKRISCLFDQECVLPRFVSARTRSCSLPSETSFKCSVPTPFSLNSFSFL